MMYSRIVRVPSGSRTASRCTFSSAPSKTCAPSIRVSSRWRSDETLVRAGRGSFAIDPLLRDQEVAVEFRFVAAECGLPIVAPLGQRRERQKNRFRAPSGLQAEKRSAIPHEIEFNVATAAICLEIALALAVRQVLAAKQNRLGGGEKMIADRSGQREAAIKAAGRNIVVKNPTDTTRLATMLQEKIIVAPALELGMEVVTKRFECLATSPMKMHGVLGVTVIRRQIHAAAEPPDGRPHARGFRRFAAPPGGVIRALGRPGGANGVSDETAHVQMHGRRMWIARMKDERYAHRLPCAARKTRPLSRRRRRRRGADDVREKHTAAFDDVAVFDRTRHAAATLGPRPFVTAERQTVDRFDRRHDASLQREEISARRGKIHGEPRSPRHGERESAR